ncbi:hypothetical protein QE152_g23260 [Popillia japonica]|uniref:Uncharacterized protein n=1 Tax=Popillia japonica TaxID=7064 RepID=A0AAW1KI09_POPJA
MNQNTRQQNKTWEKQEIRRRKPKKETEGVDTERRRDEERALTCAFCFAWPLAGESATSVRTRLRKSIIGEKGITTHYCYTSSNSNGRRRSTRRENQLKNNIHLEGEVVENISTRRSGRNEIDVYKEEREEAAECVEIENVKNKNRHETRIYGKDVSKAIESCRTQSEKRMKECSQRTRRCIWSGVLSVYYFTEIFTFVA